MLLLLTLVEILYLTSDVLWLAQDYTKSKRHAAMICH